MASESKRVEHTELPWHAAEPNYSSFPGDDSGLCAALAENIGIRAKNNHVVCDVWADIPGDNHEANARYIVLSANFHHRLVKSLGHLIDAVRFWHPDDEGWLPGTRSEHPEMVEAESLLAEIEKEGK